jgi:protease I
MPGPLDGKRILILATNGFEQSELEVPRDKLKEAGAEVHVASPEQGEIKGWDKKDWGRPVKVTGRSAARRPTTTMPSCCPAGR